MQQLNEQHVQEWFSAIQPRSARKTRNIMLLCLGLTLYVVFFSADPRLVIIQEAARIILAILFLGLLFVPWYTMRKEREFRRRLAAATEQVQLEAWEQAAPLIDSLGSRPIRSGTDRNRASMLLAAWAESQHKFDISTAIYESLLIRTVGDGHQLQETQLALVAAKLRNEELTDALTMLDRLEKATLPQPLRTILDLTRLYQQLFMGHFADAVENLTERRKGFQRYLSTRAGYAYGLFALAMHRLGNAERAADLWRDATTLISKEKLLEEYPLMAPVAAAYKAVEHPL